MKCVFVSHTHWDREWYRTFEQFRARLVDAVDRVLELLARDPGFRFLLDGQVVVVEDYLAVRPARKRDVERAVRAGRLAIGPWYVQPDSLLPSGEALIRNLLEGRRAGSKFGGTSRVAYTPDSFGHPAQLPQILVGFGLQPFVFWRGAGDELDRLPAEFSWVAPDGSAVQAHHLSEGYFSAADLPRDPRAAAARLERVAQRLRARTRNECVLLLNGIDHALPDPHTAAVVEELARCTGWRVERGLLEDFAREIQTPAPEFRGELLGARAANLLPGVWSSRLPWKLRNRRVEMLIEAWAEPWSAIARHLRLCDETPAVRRAWRRLLENQAHDSICGCSIDRVHEQMMARYDAAEELARETVQRVLERMAGLGVERRTPGGPQWEVAVFNPSPHRRSDLVAVSLDPHPWWEIGGEAEGGMQVHPLLAASALAEGFTADGQPVRAIPAAEGQRVQALPGRAPRDVEFVAVDVPAFGWRRVRLLASEAHPEVEDAGTEIARGALAVRAATDGTLAVQFGDRSYAGLCGVEDVADRGDTYDADPIPDRELALERVEVRRRRHPSGILTLCVRRVFSAPSGLAPDRQARAGERVPVVLEVEARLIPRVERVDLRVSIENNARDHRLRLLFPTGAPAVEFAAAATFDIARRPTAPRQGRGWVHPAPRTFPHHGFVSANGLTVAAPGLPEAEVTPAGVIAITLLRAVGWLARADLRTRPQLAGPPIPTPRAQCLGRTETRLALFGELDPRAVRDAEVGLWAVVAGEVPAVPAGRSMLEIEPRELLWSALYLAASGGSVLRVLNPTDGELHARIRVGFPIGGVSGVRLDESPCEFLIERSGDEIRFRVPAHALRSLWLHPPRGRLRGAQDHWKRGSLTARVACESSRSDSL